MALHPDPPPPTLFCRIWNIVLSLLNMLRPYPHGLRVSSQDLRGERERAHEAVNRVEERLSRVKVIIEAADGASRIVQHRGGRS